MNKKQFRQMIEKQIELHSLAARVLSPTRAGWLVECAAWDCFNKCATTVIDEISSLKQLNIWLGY